MSRSIIPWFFCVHTHTISPGRKNKRTTQDNFSPTHVSIKSVQLSHYEGILDTWGMSMLPPILHWILMSLPSSYVEALTPHCNSIRTRWSRWQVGLDEFRRVEPSLIILGLGPYKNRRDPQCTGLMQASGKKDPQQELYRSRTLTLDFAASRTLR